jgi:WD40 repeat protein
MKIASYFFPKQTEVPTNKLLVQSPESPIKCLSEELILKIFSLLAFRDLQRVKLVSKQWNYVAQDESLYHLFCRECFPETCKKEWMQRYVEKKSWNSAYKLLRGMKIPSHIFRGDNSYGPASVAIEGNIFAIADLSGIRVWDLLTGKLRCSLGKAVDSYREVHIALENNRLVSTVWWQEHSKALMVWDIISKTVLCTLDAHTDEIYTVAIKDHYVVSGSRDGTIKVWDIKKGCSIFTFTKHLDSVNAVAIAENKVISASDDGSVKLWDLSSGECVGSYQKHRGPVKCVAMEGNLVASGGVDKTVQVWNIQTGESVCALTGGHEDAIRQLIIQDKFILSLDYRSIVIGIDEPDSMESAEEEFIRYINRGEKDADKNVVLWDMNTQKCIRKYHTNAWTEAAFQGNIILMSYNGVFKRKYKLKSLGNYKRYHHGLISKLKNISLFQFKRTQTTF